MYDYLTSFWHIVSFKKNSDTNMKKNYLLSLQKTYSKIYLLLYGLTNTTQTFR